ncbi:MAG: cytochrome c3 family protein [Bacteroidetes bacterium]|nr:cytochrome c3 family protein [Bacteroidota bacterium]
MNKNKINKVIILLILFVLFNFLLTSCSAEKNYETLTFFFDGVPDPNAKPSLTDSNKTTKEQNLKQYVKSEEIFTHPPYGDRACENCHDAKSANRLNASEPGLCYQCHDDFSKNLRYVHGPIASGYCTQCHEPHQGKYKNLLIRDGQKLCYYCHEKNDVLENENHTGIEDTKCWDCHDPHGSNEKHFLK